MRGSVAKRYARALHELGVERDSLESFQSELNEIASIYQDSKELRAILLNPAVGLDERKEVLRRIAEKAGWDDAVRNFALLLLDKERFVFIDDIALEFQELVDEHLGNVRATVTTASVLKDSQVAGLQGAIAKLTGKNVLLETEVDEELLGGVVARVGSMIYDGSVRTQLQNMRESILKEV